MEAWGFTFLLQAGSMVIPSAGASGRLGAKGRARKAEKLVPQKYRRKFRKVDLVRFNLSGKNGDPEKSSFFPRGWSPEVAIL